MKAMMLIAGSGTRLRPLTNHLPKCMVPVAGKPVLQHAIEWCRGFGIQEFVLNPCYLPEVVTSYFGDGRRFGVHIHYSPEQEALGTAGAVKRAARHFDGPFLVWYGDNVSRCNIARLCESHRAKGGLATIALHPREEVSQSGIVGLDAGDRITRFLEKPLPEQVFSHWVNAGIYILERAVLEAIPGDVPSDFGGDVLPRLLAGGAALYGYRLSEDEGLWWLDRPEDLERLQASSLWALPETISRGSPQILEKTTMGI
jgi:NDP-sugar pyrophosphorylase family protein